MILHMIVRVVKDLAYPVRVEVSLDISYLILRLLVLVLYFTYKHTQYFKQTLCFDKHNNIIVLPTSTRPKKVTCTIWKWFIHIKRVC